MDLKYLNTFRVIVEEGSFSKAAERLNYTQSTITFQIGQLEQELSSSLFEKIGRKMVLSKAGEQLIPYVDEVLSSVERLRCFEDDLAECQGDLRIGVGETLLCYQLPAILKEFHKQAPKARLFLRSMNCYDIRDDLKSGALDLGVFYEDVGGFGSSLTTHPFGTYPLALVASPELRSCYPDFITPDQQIPVPFIINEPNCVFRQIFERYLREKSIMLDHTIELWSIPTIKNLVKNDVGISFLPRFAVQAELDERVLAEIPTGLTDTIISAVCGYHKNKWISPLMKLFIGLCSAKDQPFLI
ncbi:DNA-binding transcriptional regulator, LysR family [Lacrimispora sphenoides]|jgi:DNA-binding transcriptional LysR family regulator|uniref:LysR family transcriptional regulator n=1 Tax=Lacrimispora sphenoides TaxID=29370 RepID=UPI0008BE8B9B|nr:LysR family transcriptional regulator [Lacrimispora sphenoides]SET80469.1 DNA-binding transcriptional regulator, LysR family [Lacrimispora sphenoides]